MRDGQHIAIKPVPIAVKKTFKRVVTVRALGGSNHGNGFTSRVITVVNVRKSIYKQDVDERTRIAVFFPQPRGSTGSV